MQIIKHSQTTYGFIYELLENGQIVCMTFSKKNNNVWKMEGIQKHQDHQFSWQQILSLIWTTKPKLII